LSTVLSALSPLAFYIINQEYIAQNLCENKTPVNQECQGKCYLNNQLSEVSEKENHEISFELEKFPELLNEFSPRISTSIYTKVISSSNSSNHYVLEWIYEVFHPPAIV
jgi:hypothetical protein